LARFPEAVARGVTLRSEVTPGETVVVAPDNIERVLANLVANAVRHTQADGSVAVSVERHSREVCVHVDDDGVGLEPGTQERMFERFWRADRSRTGPGAGLGLAIARGLVEAHGGHIWAESRPDGGARVSFSLPAAA
jgi:two-component system phosphate regulon sensor histidine kinase PhoR